MRRPLPSGVASIALSPKLVAKVTTETGNVEAHRGERRFAPTATLRELGGEEETVGRDPAPAFYGRALGGPVEGRVYLHGGKRPTYSASLPAGGVPGPYTVPSQSA